MREVDVREARGQARGMVKEIMRIKQRVVRTGKQKVPVLDTFSPKVEKILKGLPLSVLNPVK